MQERPDAAGWRSHRGALKGRTADAIFPTSASAGEQAMTQTTNRFFDEVARLMNDAAGVAQGVRREFDTLVKTQTERWLRDLDLIKREENEALKVRIAALEAKLGVGNQSPPTPQPMPDHPGGVSG